MFLPVADVRSLFKAPPERHLLSLVATALISAALFHLLVVSVLMGSMSVVLPVTQYGTMMALAGLIGYFTIRAPSAPAVALAATFLASMVGLAFATEAGYGIHFIGRGFPLADPILAGFDRAIGFHSRDLLLWVDKRPILAAWLSFCYVGCAYQVLIAIPAMIASGRNARLLISVGANFFGLFIVNIFALFFPAVGAYGFYHFTAADHPHIVLAASGTVSQVETLRAENIFMIPAGSLQGLVTFPSYHMFSACLFAWLFWPSRLLRWPMVFFNASVAVSALVDGCHYFADLIAGAILTFACINMVRTIARRFEALVSSAVPMISRTDPQV